MSTSTIFQPNVLSLMPTWQCPAACDDCGTFSHPRNTVRLPFADVVAAIHKAADSGFQIVVFTGGEATLRWPELLEWIRLAQSVGLGSRLVTNAWWAKGPKVAGEMLRELREAGLNEINFSTGDQHVRFVPIEHIANALVASVDSGFAPQVMIELTRDALVTRRRIEAETDVLSRLGERIRLVTFTESPWMPMDVEAPGHYAEDRYVSRKNLATRGGCGSLFNTHTIQADGTITACCGLGIVKIKQLHVAKFDRQKTNFVEVEQSAESDLLRLLIKRFGPERLLAKVSAINPAIDWEDQYAHQCQACARVLTDETIHNTIRANEAHFWAELTTALATDRLLQVQ